MFVWHVELVTSKNSPQRHVYPRMESLPALFYTAPRGLEHTTFVNKGQFSISQWFSSLLSAGTTQKLTSMGLAREALYTFSAISEVGGVCIM